MRLVCNGFELELKDGASLSFKKSNVLFAFDKAECERSVSFDLPSTPNNERVLQFAKLPAYSGVGMRRRFTAQLQDGIVTKNGYLYVDSYNGTSYKAIFVTGELVGLQAIREAGKVSELIESSLVTLWDASWVVSAAAGNTQTWRCIDYRTQSGAPHPSMRLQDILSAAFAAVGSTMPTIPASAAELRVVPADVQPMQEQQATITRTVTGAYVESSDPSDYNVVCAHSLTGGKAYLSQMLGTDTEDWLAWERYVNHMYDSTFGGKVTQYVARQAMEIVFPADWAADAYMVKADGGGVTFYGDRSFTFDQDTEQFVRSGEPLAGRSVELSAGDKFMFVDEGDYYFFKTDFGGTLTVNVGWYIQGGRTWDVGFVGKDVSEGMYVALQDNLPEVTLVDLLRIVAAVSGKVLYYDGAVSFDDLDVSTWAVMELSERLVGLSDVQRKFADYAQRNVVAFDSDETLLLSEHIVSDYAIDNDNLDTEKELQAIPFSEGKRYGYFGGREVLYLVNDNETDTLSDAGTTGRYMVRCRLLKNAGLRGLCTKATQVKVTLLLTLAEWERLTAKTLLQINGLRYVWTEGQWKDGKATLTLNAIV